MKIKVASEQKFVDMVTPSKNSNFGSNLRKSFKEYTESTGIHGIRYLTEERSVFEKIFWTVILLTSLGGCSFMVYQIIQKFQSSPVILVFATKGTPLFEIPFPAVTVCPESKCLETKFNYSQIHNKIFFSESTIDNYTEFRYFYYVSMLSNLAENVLLQKYNISIEDDIFEISHKLKPSEIVECSYMGQDCLGNLTPIVTDQGICYSFNIIDKKDMFKDYVYYYKDFQNVSSQPLAYRNDRGFLEKTEIHTYPKRALMSGADNFLKLGFVHSWYTSDLIYNMNQQGHQVLVHNPLEFPRLRKSYFHLPLGKTVVAIAQPHVVTTSDAVKAFSPEKRNCYLENERSLYYFKSYTQPDCLLECETNYTLNYCGCVSFYMPRRNATRICDFRDYECTNHVSRQLKTEELKTKISGVPDPLNCDCKLSCTSLEYKVETSSSDNYIKEYLTIFKNATDMLDLQNHHYSVLTVYLNDDEFIAIERNELYGTSDLVSNFGGLLGLFTGFSLISGVEIIYFVTLRIFYNIRLYGRWFDSTIHP